MSINTKFAYLFCTFNKISVHNFVIFIEMVAQEFQAVVFAGGRGARCPDIIGDRPKCLLPIGPVPLLWYPLHTLEKHGFQEAIVIVIESQKSDIQQKMDRTPLKLKIEYATIPSDSDYGTADALRSISERIKTNILVISCDTIMDVDLFPLLRQFREREAAVSALFLYGQQMDPSIQVPGQTGKKQKPERDLIAINPQSNRLIFMASMSDFEENVTLPGHLMRSNGKVNMFSGLLDVHVYVIRKWVIDYLDTSSGFSTIKGEFIPFIIKKQMGRPKDATAEIEKALSELNLNTKIKDVFDFVPQPEIDVKINEASIFNETKSERKYAADLIRCYAYIAPKTSFGVRVNTVPMYCLANLKVVSLWDKLVDAQSLPLMSANSTIKSTQMTNCAVGENTSISEKTSLTDSVISGNCTVNPKTRIFKSILMNSVTIEEGVTIENCIVCDKVIIKSGCVLKNCLVGPNYVVTEGQKLDKASLQCHEGFMEI